MTAKRELMRAFEHVSLPHGDDGRKMPGIKAPCGTCETKGHLVVNTMGNGGGNDDEVEWKFIARKMEQKGWHIGRRRQDHRCPRCLDIERLTKVGSPPACADKFTKRETMMSSTTVKPPPRTPPELAAKLGQQAADKTMTRDDRRIIFAKLEEVYIDDKTGYGDGWSDEKVALHLGVPRAWVRVIRDENFGEEITSEVTRKMIDEARGMLATVNRHRGEITQAMAKLMPLFERADKIEKHLADIAKVMK